MIVHKFLETYALPFDEAQDLFTETKKWLWLVAGWQYEASRGGRSLPPPLMIDAPLLLLDEMWHTFILFTRQYTEYCQKHFGRYIHHAPATKEEKEEAHREYLADPRRAQAKREEQLRAQYGYIYDRLKENTVLKWYSDYAGRHSPEFVRGIRR